MKAIKIEFFNKRRWFSIFKFTTCVLFILITGCQVEKTEKTASMDSEEVDEEVVDDRYFGGCGRSRNTKGDEAYMSVTHTRGEKHLEGVCFGKNVNGPIWTGKFTGEVVSSDAYLFKIKVEYQINGKTITVKEKWKKVDDFIELDEAEPTRPDIPTDYLLVNCFTEFAEQQAFVDNMEKSANIKAAEKYYKAIDINGSVIVKLKYYAGKPEVTGMILGKMGEEDMWYGLVSARCINGKTDSLRVKVEYNEGTDEYTTSWQTWHIDKFSLLKIKPDHSDNKPGWVFMPIDLPNGFPDKETFEKTYKDYHNEID